MPKLYFCVWWEILRLQKAESLAFRQKISKIFYLILLIHNFACFRTKSAKLLTFLSYLEQKRLNFLAWWIRYVFFKILKAALPTLGHSVTESRGFESRVKSKLETVLKNAVPPMLWWTRNRKNAVVFLSKIIADVATFKKPETCFALHDEWPMGPFFKTSHIHWPLQKWYHLNNSLDKITGTISWVLQEGKRYGTAHQHTSHSW